MEMRVKKGHPHGGHPAPTTSTGQPGGKRTQDYGYATGNSGGKPTPTPIKHPAISKVLPDDAHTHGQPQPGDPIFRKVGPMGQGFQPGHPDLHHHKPTVTGGKDVVVWRHGGKRSPNTERPISVRQLIQKTGSSHSVRMRAEGQKLHESGLKVGGRADEKPYTNRGHMVRPQPNEYRAAKARLDDGKPDREIVNNPGEEPGHSGNLIEPFADMHQPRVAKFGSAKRFKRLMMTKKTDGGRY